VVSSESVTTGTVAVVVVVVVGAGGTGAVVTDVEVSPDGCVPTSHFDFNAIT
jgi:hypothetical protein